MERNPITVPITKENFPEMWAIVDKERRTAKKKKLISGFVSFFGHMMLAFLLLVTVNGLLYNHTSGSYHDFLESIPHLLPLWEKYSILLLKPGQTWQTQAVLSALAVYAIDFVFCALLILVLTALYHPLRKKLPEGEDKENARQLLDHAHSARVYANHTKRTAGAVIWTFLGLFLWFFLLQFFVYETGISREQIILMIYPEADMTSSVSMNSFSLLVYALAFALILLYTALAAIHTCTVQFLYRYHVPYSFVAAVEKYYVLIEETNPETAEAKRKEALYLETIGAYGRSKELLAEAAHAGDVEAMEHYARHNLIGHLNDPARYWLEQAVASGKASPETVKNLKRLKWHRKINVRYLTETDKVER